MNSNQDIINAMIKLEQTVKAEYDKLNASVLAIKVGK